ncbi:type II toxin-antitoxin system RelE/ParE family toxin [Marivirga sericea]|uniref:type II toxin-antitoxin system RelE/ParE family toxin n=1 Tax=Marivirga sericea TaxID=1028 RepID=UPI0021D222A3|nr:type II toxin-antitoxin system RelE/ParE family toxin [Marivirga sericea]
MYTFETRSEGQADDYYQMLLSRCNDIANKPNLGKQYPQVKDGLLGIKTNRHIIFYRVLDFQRIEIIRILHGRMDIASRLEE